jgi:hypothetical protein
MTVQLPLFNYRTDRPVAQRVAIDLPAFRDGTKQSPIFDGGRTCQRLIHSTWLL